MIVTVIKDLIRYTIHPYEKNHILAGEKWFVDFCLLYLILFVLNISANILILLLMLIFGESSPLEDIKDSSIIMCIVVVVIEEVACRLPLVRKQWYISVSSALLASFAYCILFKIHFLSMEMIVTRIMIALMAGAAAFYFFQYIKRIQYKYYYYSLALIFGFLHLTNVFNWTLSAYFIAVCLCYCITKTIGGLIFGYVRMKYGFFYAIGIHFINNVFPFLFQ